jgi:hypothetical protein
MRLPSRQVMALRATWAERLLDSARASRQL